MSVYRTFAELATAMSPPAPVPETPVSISSSSKLTEEEHRERRHHRLKWKGLSSRGEFILECARATYRWLRRYRDCPIVLLGRDTWPLVPLLRYWGIPVQYFLCSRLQIDTRNIDPYEPMYLRKERAERSRSTARQWMREVPPGAVVIDSGYVGTIPTWLEQVDPTIKRCGLLSSCGKYKQILETIEHRCIVGRLEHTPKLTGRCIGYNANETALCPRRYMDCDDDEMPLSEARGFFRTLVWDLGLPSTWRAKYRNFTGLTPKERLDMDAAAREEHYRKVSYSRGTYDYDGHMEEVWEENPKVDWGEWMLEDAPVHQKYSCLDGQCGYCSSCGK